MTINGLKKIRHAKDFDAFDAFILLEDIETKQIVFRNRAYLKEVEKTKDKRPAFDTRFISINSFISQVDGRDVVVEFGTKINPVTSSSYNLTLRSTISEIEGLMREEIHNDFLFALDGIKVHYRIINAIVHHILKFYGSEYAHLFIFKNNYTDKGSLHTYHISQENAQTNKDVYLNSYWANSLGNFFEKGYSLLCEDMHGFMSFDAELRDKFLQRNIDAIIMIPFFAENRLKGLLMVSKPNNSNDTETPDFFLMDYATNAIGTMITRGYLYNDLYFDKMTGFPWSNVIDTLYADYLEKQKDLPIVIMEFDILHFRVLNRSYGTEFGDRLLKKIAEILKRKYPNSLLSRKNSSDTFVVITTGVAENIAIEANNILQEVRSAFSDIMPYIAFGIYQVKDKKENPNLSFFKAMFAHRFAKEHLNQNIRIYDEELDKREQQYQHYTNNFVNSIKKEEFEVYIQPRYNLQTDTYYGGEALIRWKLDNRLVMPGDFIPLFENNGLCRELDLYVVKKVCQTIARWMKESPAKVVPISINISRTDFIDELLFEKILFIINDYKIPTQYIELEITESAYADYEKQIIDFLNKCKATGIHVLMDDFGSGVSSFNSLKNLDIDVLKLDYKFLSKEGNNEKKRKIIQSIVSLARSINLQVVVEGVETKNEAAFFKKMGIRYVQGYLFGKPMPIAEFEKIANRKAEPFVEEQADSRLLVDEILDSKSNANLLFTKSSDFAGIFRCDGKGVYPILLNEWMEYRLSYIEQLKNFYNGDLLDYVDPRIKDKVLDCLTSSRELYVYTDKKDILFRFGVNTYHFRVHSMLLKESNGERYYLISGTYVSKENEHKATIDIKEEIEWYLNDSNQGCLILDKDGYVIKYNAIAQSYFKNIKRGINIKELTGFVVEPKDATRRQYNRLIHSVLQYDIKCVTNKEEQLIIISISNLGLPSKFVSEGFGGGFKFYDRALSALEKLAAFYVEIDLTDDTYLKLILNPDLYEGGSYLSAGSYSKGLFVDTLNNVSIDDRKKYAEKMSLASLIEASKSLSPSDVFYKISGQKQFYEIKMKFYHDSGHYYASYYCIDITQTKLKDFDTLTGCMSRNGGGSFIESYFKQHPLQKMAFIIIDLDKFKSLNDTYGHPLGDKVLAQMHHAFKKLPDAYRYSTRLGGDEFCILLKDRGNHMDKDVIRKEIDDVIKKIGLEVGLGIETHCSCGFALFPEDGNNIDALYSVADKDLYEHKKKKKLKE